MMHEMAVTIQEPARPDDGMLPLPESIKIALQRMRSGAHGDTLPCPVVQPPSTTAESATMVALDDTLPERSATLLDLAAAGVLSLARSGCYRDAPDTAPR